MGKRYRIVDGLTASDVACMSFGEIWTRLMQMGGDRDTARAEAAMLREALAQCAVLACVDLKLTHEEDDACSDELLEFECEGCKVRNLINTALSGSSGEWLVGKIADATRELFETCSRLQAERDGLAKILDNLRQYEAVDGYEGEDKLVGLAYHGSIWGPCTNPKNEPYELAESVAAWLKEKTSDEAIAKQIAFSNARDARITAEARRKALLGVAEAALEKYGASPTQHWLAKMAQEADHA